MDVENENVLNNANLVKCGNHAVVETWPIRSLDTNETEITMIPISTIHKT